MMLNKYDYGHHPRRESKGAMMLVSVSLLLVIASLVTVHTGRVKSLEHKILLNSQNQALSSAAAQGGLAHGMSLMQSDVIWQGEEHNITFSNNARAIVSAQFNPFQRNGLNTQWATIESAGLSADGQSRHQVSEQVLRYPFLHIIPPVPLISAVDIPSDLRFVLGANPNAGGNGVPVSIWTDKTLSAIDVDSRTCALQIFDENRCALDMYSNNTNLGIDTLQEHEGFPADVLEYLFNIPVPDWHILKSEVSLIAADCEPLTIADTRVIWIQGECRLEIGQQIGSIDTPIMLILADSALLMPEDSQIFGLVIYLSTQNPPNAKRIAMAASAQLNGALVLLSPIDAALSQLAIRYQLNVLTQLHQDADMQRIGKISGSWRDF
ncbi:hypothetical protein [Paraglaciecola sp. T6c]|uniref:hypothetical protein n=1 Tax=Pseudoalteromonas atlantica (strain T6c / ATCC BAA-1087) TaxID=3042615 RepID=UPI001E373CA5|nr:hypothetical protein [Paraglaciecola sp. T6c]